MLSGSDLEQAGNDGSLCLDVVTVDGVNPSLPNRRHRLLAGQRSLGGRQAAEAESRPHPASPLQHSPSMRTVIARANARYTSLTYDAIRLGNPLHVTNDKQI